MLKNHLQYWSQLCNLSSFVHYHKWYSVEFMLHSRGRVMNDSTLRIRIARFGPSFSLCSFCITVAAQEGASGQSAVSAFACLPPLVLQPMFCCQTTFVVCVGGSQLPIVLGFTPLEIFDGNTSPKVHAGLRQVTRTYLVIELHCVVMSWWLSVNWKDTAVVGQAIVQEGRGNQAQRGLASGQRT